VERSETKVNRGETELKDCVTKRRAGKRIGRDNGDGYEENQAKAK
jgi:hypothetical protein